MADNSSSVNAFWKDFNSLSDDQLTLPPSPRNQFAPEVNPVPSNRRIRSSSVDSFWTDYKSSIPQRNFWLNNLAGVGERTSSLVGNFLQFAGNVAQGGERWAYQTLGFNPYLKWDEDGLSFTFSEDPDSKYARASWGALDDAGEDLSTVDLGFNENRRFTWEDYKGDWKNPKALAGYMVESGLYSLPDMAGAIFALPAYVASRTQEIAEQRELNKGRFADGKITVSDLQESLPTAVGVAALERIGAKGILNSAGEGLFRGAVKGATKEGITEFLQEGLEYTGEVVGTETPFDPMTALDRSLAGAVAGSGIGSAGGAVSGVYGDPNATSKEFQYYTQAEIDAMRRRESGLEPVVTGLLGSKIIEAQNESKAAGGDSLDQANSGAQVAAANVNNLNPTQRLRSRQGMNVEPPRLLDPDELAGTSAENPIEVNPFNNEIINNAVNAANKFSELPDVDPQLPPTLDALIDSQLTKLGEVIVLSRKEQRAADNEGNQTLSDDLEADIGTLQLAQNRLREARDLQKTNLQGKNIAIANLVDEANTTLLRESGRREAYAYNEILEGEILPPLSETIEMLRAGGALPQQDRLQISSPPDLVVDSEGVATQYDGTGQRRIGRSDPNIIFGERPESVVRRKANGKAYPTEKSAQVALKNIQKAETEYNWSVIKEGNKRFALEGKLQRSEEGPRTTGVTEITSQGALDRRAMDQSLAASLEKNEAIKIDESREKFDLKEALQDTGRDIAENEESLKKAEAAQIILEKKEADDIKFTDPPKSTDSLWLTIMKTGGLDYDQAVSEGVIDPGNGFFNAQPKGHTSPRWTVFKKQGKYTFDSLAEHLNELNWGLGKTLTANDVVELVGEAMKGNASIYNPAVERDSRVEENVRYIEELEIYQEKIKGFQSQLDGTSTDPSTIFKVEDLITAGIPQDLIDYHYNIENFDNMSGEIYAADTGREEGIEGSSEKISAVDTGTDSTIAGIERGSQSGVAKNSEAGVSQNDGADQGISNEQDGTGVNLLQSYTEGDLQDIAARDVDSLDAKEQIDRERDGFGLDSPSGSVTSDALEKLQDNDLVGFGDVQPSGKAAQAAFDQEQEIRNKNNPALQRSTAMEVQTARENEWKLKNRAEIKSFWLTASKEARRDLLTRADALGDTPRKQKMRINQDKFEEIGQEPLVYFTTWAVDNWDSYLAEYKSDYNNMSPADKARSIGRDEDALKLIEKEEIRNLVNQDAESPSKAPEHRNSDSGVSNAELKSMVASFDDAKKQYDAQSPNEKITAIFDEPKPDEIVRLKNKANAEVSESGYLSEGEANQRIQTWRANAIDQGQNPLTRRSNSQKVVLSLFDLSGEWAKPWREAGYDVYTFDIQDDNYLGDVNNFSTDFFADIFGMFDGKDIHAILAACPCTDFASSGARHFATKDADGRTVASVELVQSTLATIEYFKPNIWAIENPVGRIGNMNGLPHWRLSLDPYQVGEDYTKQTLFWGRFNGDLPVAPREPVKGSKMHTMFGGSSIETKNARSETPEGFSYAFFQANNALDHPVMTASNKYEMMDKEVLESAIGHNFSGGEIAQIVDDAYFIDVDYEKANDLLKDAIQADPQVDDNSDPALSRMSPYLLRNGILTDKNFDSVIERVTGKDRVASDNIVVVDTYFELPFDLREKAEQQNAGPGGIQGAFHRGKVYLVRDQVSSEKEAEEVLLHEGTHGGFRDMYDDNNVKAALNKLYAGMGGRSGFMDTIEELGITERIQVYLKDLDNAVDNSAMDVETRNAILVEEVIAFTGQQGSKTLRLRIKEVIGAIKEWLRNTGYVALSKITSSDIARMAKKARDNFFRNEQYTSDNDPAFSLENPPKSDFRDTRRNNLYSNAARIIEESGDKLFRTSKKNPMGLAGGEQIFSFLKNKISKTESRISEISEFLLGDPVGSKKAKFSKDEVIRYFGNVMPEIETVKATGMGEDLEIEWDNAADSSEYNYERYQPDIEYEAERDDWNGDAGEVLGRMLERLKGEGLILKVQDSGLIKNYDLDDFSGKDDLVSRFEEDEVSLYKALDNQFYQTEFSSALEEWIQTEREPFVDIRHSDLDAWNDLEFKIVGDMDLNREEGFLTVLEYTKNSGWTAIKDVDTLRDAKEFVDNRIREDYPEVYSDMYSETQHFPYVIGNTFRSEQSGIIDYAENTYAIEDNPYSGEQFYQAHFDGITNLLVDVITTDRPFASGSGNMKVIEEAQSDWDQQITDKGGRFQDGFNITASRIERDKLGKQNDKQKNDYLDLVANGDFEFKFPSVNIIREGVSKPLEMEKNIKSYGTSVPDFNRAVTVKGKTPKGDAERYGREYMGIDLLEKSLRTLAHTDALREVFTDKGYSKLLRNAENYTKSNDFLLGEASLIDNFNPASWEFVGDGPMIVQRDFRQYIERTINQDDIRAEHQQTYLDALYSTIPGKAIEVNLFKFFRNLNYSMIPETINYLDKSLDSSKYREANSWMSIFDKNASTVLHSLANFHSAKLLVFNNPRKRNSKRLTETERGYIAPISQSLADSMEVGLQSAGASMAYNEQSDLAPEMPFGNDEYLKLAAKKTLLDAVDGGFDYVGHANGTRQAIKTSSSRVGRRMNFQYNQKFPSIFEKLTGQKPILVDPQTNKIYTSPNPENLFQQADGTPFDATARANKEKELAEIEGSVFLKLQSNYAEAGTLLDSNALLDKNLLVVYPITPELKEKIAYEGLPMFSRTGEETGRLYLKRSSSETMSDLITRKIQDKFLPVKRLQQSIEEQTQDKIHEDADPYLAEELFYGKTEEDLRQIDLTLVEPLMEDLKASGLSVKDLDDYLIAKHAPERNTYIASINESFPDGGSGLSTADAQAYLAKVAKDPEKFAALERNAKRIREMVDYTRDLMVEGGMVSEMEAASWQDNYDNYVPLKGFAEDENTESGSRVPTGRGYAIGGKENLRALGRNSRAASPTVQVIADMTAKNIRYRKNEVGQSFLSLAEQYPDPNFWKIFTEENPDQKSTFNSRSNSVEMMPVRMAGNDNYFPVKREGTQYYIKVEDERLLDALHKVGPQTQNTITQIANAATRWLSFVNTAGSPQFLVTNFTRDIQAAALNIQAEQTKTGGRIEGEALAKNAVANVRKAIWAIGGYELKDRIHAKPDNEYQAYYDEMLQVGGKTGFFDSPDLDKLASDINARASDATTTQQMLNIGQKLVDFVTDINTAVENGIRLSTYVEARKAGVSAKKSASLVKNLTVNFNRKGEYGQFVNSFYMFFNAAVQGLAQFGATLSPIAASSQGELRLKRNQKGKVDINRAQKIAGGMIIASYGLAALNRSMGGEDDDGIAYFDKIPASIRERNLIVMNPYYQEGSDSHQYVKVPLPYGFNFFWNLGDSFEAMVNGSERRKKDLLGGIVGSFMTAFSPLSMHSVKEDAGIVEAGLLTASPSIIVPAAEIAFNTNFFGSDIYRENFPSGAQRTDAHNYYNSTKTPYKMIAQFMNDAVGGGSEYREGDIGFMFNTRTGISTDFSPDALEHVFEYALGGIYRDASQTFDLAERVVTGRDVDRTRIPFSSRVLGRDNSDYADIDEYYRLRQLVINARKDYEESESTERMSVRQSNQDLHLLWPSIRNADKRLSNLRDRRDRAQDNKNLTPSDRDSQLENIRIRMDKEVDKFYLRYQNHLEKFETRSRRRQ